MIRFRFTEDERRYLLLLSEAYRLIAQHLPVAAAARVMRNLGKLEQMASLEGVRQGLAIAELSLLNEEGGRQTVRGLKAFQAHAVIYGSTDTPLREAELEWLDKLGAPEDTSDQAWLDHAPMRFAPQTLAEWKEEQSTPPHFSRLEDLDPDLLPSEMRRLPDPNAGHGAVDGFGGSDFDDFPGPTPDDAGDRQERPAMLDQLRDVIAAIKPKPATWTDLILQVHRVTGIDAGFLDLQLSTDMGRTVLAQCGVQVDPGMGINLQEISDGDA